MHNKVIFGIYEYIKRYYYYRNNSSWQRCGLKRVPRSDLDWQILSAFFQLEVELERL